MEDRKPRGRPPLRPHAQPIEELEMSETNVTDERPAMRQAMREEDPRARAAKRAAELRDHVGDMDGGTDDFYVDPSIIPPGWSYEWKRETVYGQEDPAYQVQLARTGWEPVPADRHSSYMPRGSSEAVICRKGMVLMERPAEITNEFKNIELKKARAQVREKEASLNEAKPGQFERSDKNGSLVKVRKGYEPIPIPD